MASLERSLVPIEISTQIDRLREGGLISRALSGPERSMDRMISGHLERVAILQARGDTIPERPMYVFNPDSRLLIKYSLRRDADPARSGLFAEVVELDEKGKPRHGVNVVSPFKTNTGFIQVAVGDNPHGFPPSFVETKIDSDDPLSMIPPNIATADLLAMLSAEPIAENEKLEEFLARTDKKRTELRQKAEQRHRAQYIGTTQGLTHETNPYVHLIISDRDTTVMESASREAGLFPFHLTGDSLIEIYTFISQKTTAKKNFESNFSFKSRLWMPMGVVADSTPGVITYDNLLEPESKVEGHKNFGGQYFRAIREIIDGLVNNNPVFAQLRNDGFPEGVFDGKVNKLRNGYYRQGIDFTSSGSMKEYADWLRKTRLDLALTLYFRGLSEVV